MERDVDLNLQDGLRRSNARFVASMSRILERYNHPFEDDLLVSLETLTYNTPDGPKHWGHVSTKNVKKWKKEIFEYNRESQRNAEISREQTSDFEDEHSAIHQESENSHVDTSDIAASKADNYFSVEGEASDVSTVSVRRKFENIHLQNRNVGDGKIQKKEKVRVDVIVQDNARNIPKWITITRQGNQVGVYKKKRELSNECSSSRYLQLPYSSVPTSSNTITTRRKQTSPELSKTLCDSIPEEYQSADEECSWSNVTLADLYPAMVEILTKLMTKQSRRKELKHIFGHLKSKKWYSRRPKLNVTADKIRGFRPCKLKKALHSPCSSRSEDNQDATFGNESRAFCYDNCLINNSSGLVPRAYTDKNDIKMVYSDSSLEQHLVPEKGPKVSKQTAFPNVMARMGETFLVEDELETTASPKNSEYTESEKLAFKCSSEYHFTTSTASSGSTALHLVKESKSKAQKTDFSCVGTSEACSSCSSYGNSGTSTHVKNYSPARSSNTLFINPEKTISERQISFQHKQSFPSFMRQSPSKMPQKYEDTFEKLYYKVCSKEIQKPLTLARPLLNSQNLEEKGKLVKKNLSDFVKSSTESDREFDRIYEQLCSDTVPKFPGFQTASNLRTYEGTQMSETVNALVSSPVRTSSAISRVKRAGNFQNDLLFSPVKRQKHIPEQYFSSRKCQDISHIKKVNLQRVGMDFLSTYSCNNPSFFEDNCQSQDSGFHDSSDKTFPAIPGTSLQESGTADNHSGWPRAMENCSSPRNVSQCRHQRVYRKLSYTDGERSKS